MNQKGKHLTINDLARLARVSKTTVSDALRNHGRVTTKTRARIQALARKVGYVPNTIAATLASSRSSRINHSLSVAFVTHISAAMYNTEKFVIAKHRLEELGYQADSFDLTHDRLSPASLRQLLFRRGYRGVILHEIREVHSSLFAQDWAPFCVICAARTYHRPPFHMVRNDPFGIVSAAWNNVRAGGYTRIGFLLCRHEPRVLDDLEREGTLWVLQKDLAAHETAIPPFLGNLEDAPAIKTWFDRHRPDAVVGFNDSHVHLLASIGLRIPQDVAYASLHSDGDQPDIASVNPGDTRTPKICAEFMDQLIRRHQVGPSEHPHDILAPVSWVPGPSLPLRPPFH